MTTIGRLIKLFILFWEDTTSFKFSDQRLIDFNREVWTQTDSLLSGKSFSHWSEKEYLYIHDC